MKLRNTAWFLLAAALLAAPQDTDKQLEAAIHTEMVKGDLKAAIAQYRKIVAQNGKSRPVAARALYQLGQCQEKLGQTEARQSYEKLVKEYGDTEFAAKARIKLAIVEPQPVANRVRPARIDRRCGIPSEEGRVAACQIAGALFLRDLASGQDRRILDRPSENNRYIHQAELSPDGEKIVYVLTGSAGAFPRQPLRPQIRIVNSDGSGDRLLLDQTGIEEAWLESWSADSRQILAGVLRNPQGDRKLMVLSAYDNSARMLGLELVDATVRSTNSGMPNGAAWVLSQSPFSAYFSPDSKYVVYRSRMKRLSSIYVAPLNGGATHALFDAAAGYAPRGWMKDGRLVFVSSRAGTDDLWSVRMADGKPAEEPKLLYKRLASSALRGRVDQKGSYYYWAYTSNVKREVYKAELDLTSAQLTKPAVPVSRRYVGMSNVPAYSRDGRFLAYCSDVPGSEKIHVRNLEAGGERALDWHGTHINRLTWYPDGSALLVYGSQPGGGFFRLDVKTLNVTEVLTAEVNNDGATNPSFSPDGRYVYFKAHRKENNCVARLDLQTSNEEDIFCPGSEQYLRLFALSPDGTRLAFGARTDATDHIGVVSIAGGEPKVVYEYEGKYSSPDSLVMRAWSGLAWTADGKGIFYHRMTASDADDLWLLSLDDGSNKKLSSTGMIYSMAVHPNGREIAWDARTGSNETEMWVLENLLPPLRAAR